MAIQSYFAGHSTFAYKKTIPNLNIPRLQRMLLKSNEKKKKRRGQTQIQVKVGISSERGGKGKELQDYGYNSEPLTCKENKKLFSLYHLNLKVIIFQKQYE